jgi:tRNA dimethylallyltransferase
VSADSRQVYRGLDVGTAKPTAAERARVPHHCLDLVEPDEPFDAARFRAAALAAVADVTARGRRVLVVGGTGLYVRALVHGLCAAPPRQPVLRRALEAIAAREGVPALHRRLVAVDPAAARRIHPNDAVRAVRALEVALASGRRLSDWQAAHGVAEPAFDALVIGLAVPTPVLDACIAARVDDMLARGFVGEVRGLATRGYADDAPVWRTLGYAELRAHLEARLTLDAAREAIVRATRRFAKRQRTWFRRAEGIRWRHPVDDGARIAAETEAFLAGAHIAKGEGPE